MQLGLKDRNTMHARPVSPQMMVSSPLKNSRITLQMGFSALRSCGNCSAASMNISLSEYNRRAGLLWQG